MFAFSWRCVSCFASRVLRRTSDGVLRRTVGVVGQPLSRRAAPGVRGCATGENESARVGARAGCSLRGRLDVPWSVLALRLGAVFVAAILLASMASAQAPGVEWRRGDYFPEHPVDGSQSRDESGEDWWYDHANSFDPNQRPLEVLEGFVATGYSTFGAWEVDEKDFGGCMQATVDPNPSCDQFEEPGRLKGFAVSTLALIDKDSQRPQPLWFKKYFVGELFRVIQTSDGGYLAVGHTTNTRDFQGNPLYYNPGRSPGALTDSFDHGNGCTLEGKDMTHVVAVKTDHHGHPQWQYLYGMVPYRGPTGGPDRAYSATGQAQDVLETPSGNFIIVGKTVPDPARTYQCHGAQTVAQAFLLEVTRDGHWVFGRVFGSSTTDGSLTGIARHGSGNDLRYVVSGYELAQGSELNPYVGCDRYRRGFAMQLTPGYGIDWTTTGFNAQSPEFERSGQGSEDIAVTAPANAADRQILLPLIVDCTGCIHAGFNSGFGKVYRLSPNDGSILGSSDLGRVTAYDLKLRVTPTADGGFAAVSSKRAASIPAPPNDGCAYDTSFWGTDAYVGKFNPSGVLEWETSFDANNKPPRPFPKDQKEQECLYSITEQPDGGFVVSGNNSYNFDDSYMAKLGPPPPLPGPDLSVQDTPRDFGVEPNPDGGPMWVSQDIWVRHQPDGGMEHQNPLGGKTNTLYVRVTNRGDAPGRGLLKLYWSKASTGLAWPGTWRDFMPDGPNGPVYGDDVAPAVSIVGLQPGASRIFSVPWQVPNPDDYPPGTDRSHFCLLARIETDVGPGFGMTFQEGGDIYANTLNNNNIAWKNVTIVDARMRRQFVGVRNVATEPATVRLTFAAPGVPELGGETLLDRGSVHVELDPELFSRWEESGAVGEGIRVTGERRIRVLDAGATIENIPLEPGEGGTLAVELDLEQLPDEPVDFAFDVVQLSTIADQQKLVGGQRFVMPVGAQPLVDLQVDTSDGVATATSGQGLQYMITAVNRGQSPALGAAVDHPLPAGISGASWTCTATGSSRCGGPGAGDLRDVVNLYPGDTITYSLSATVGSSFFGRLVSATEIVEPSGTVDVDRRNNRSVDETMVLPLSGMAASKEASSGAAAYGSVVYTIVLLNGGPSVQLDNPGHELVDMLPPELSLQSASASSGTATVDVASGTVMWNGGVAVGDWVTITVRAAVNPDAPVGAVVGNQGTLSYDSDGNGTNDASSLTDDPRLPGSADVTEVNLAGVVEVPTVSTVALWLLALLLTVAALWRLGPTMSG